MNQNKSIDKFLEEFISKAEVKEEQLNKAVWILETTGNADAADLVASLSNEFRVMFSDEKAYEDLIYFKNQNFSDPLISRQIDILIKQFKMNMLPKDILKDLSIKEAALNQTYANFRSKIDGKIFTENELSSTLIKLG